MSVLAGTLGLAGPLPVLAQEMPPPRPKPPAPAEPTPPPTPPSARPAGERAQKARAASARPETDGMVLVPEGPFFMGCNQTVDPECEADELPARMVDLPAFRVDRLEVTVADYRACVEAGICSATGLTIPYWDGKEQPAWRRYCNWDEPDRERHPMNCVSWSQASAYCEWRGKRLPDEAEWEKAARGSDGRQYPWGNARLEEGSLQAALGGPDGGQDGTSPVAAHPAGASPYGALDMIGNASEWTADWYLPDRARSVRGGSWHSEARHGRVSNRSSSDPTVRNEFLGFRCAR